VILRRFAVKLSIDLIGNSPFPRLSE